MWVTDTKFLGVIVDYKLSWSSYIMNILKQDSYAIVKYWSPCPINLCMLIWIIVFVYGGKAYNTHLKILLVLKNKVMCIVTNVLSWTSASPVLSVLSQSVHQICIGKNILPVNRIYNYTIALFMYKHYDRMLLSLFDIFFCKVSDIHDDYTRKSPLQHLYADFRNTTRWQVMFSFCGATIWIGLFKNMVGEDFFRLVRTC